MEDSYTIQISSKLVNRLATADEKQKKKTKKSKPKVPQEPHLPQQSKVKPAFSSTQKSSSGGGWPPPQPPPMFLPVQSPPLPPPVSIAELEAIRSVLRESENVVEKLEKKEADMVRELTQKAKELHDKEFKLPYQKPIPCLAEREACLDCYKEHLKDPLKCAWLVKTFADCARQARQQVGSTTADN